MVRPKQAKDKHICSMSEKNQKEIYWAMQLIMWHAIIYHRRYQMHLREWGK